MSLLISYVQLIETCVSCPEQWDAKINDELTLYIRYRHGRLTAEIQKSIDGKREPGVLIYNNLIDESDPTLGVKVMVSLLTSVGIYPDLLCEYTDYDGNAYRLIDYKDRWLK